MKAMKRILILDDETSITFSLSRCLQSDSVQVITCNDILSVKWALVRFPIDAMIADVRLSAEKPNQILDLIQYLRARNYTVPLIMMSGTEDLKDQVMERGATYFFQKPVDVDDLVCALRKMGLEVGRSQNYKEADDFMFYPEVYQAY